jgi:hypothetical protein
MEDFVATSATSCTTELSTRSTEAINDAGRKAQASQRDIPAAMKLLLILAATALVAQAADQATIDDFCINGAFVQPDRFATATGSCNGQFKSESCQEDKIENACAAEADPESCRRQTSSSDCCAYLTLCQSTNCANFDEATCDSCSTLPGGERAVCIRRCKKCPACVVADAFCVP